MKSHLLRTRLPAVAGTGTHHWHVHLPRAAVSSVFSPKARSMVSARVLSILVRLHLVRGDPWLIPEMMAPNRGFNLVLFMAETCCPS